MKTVILGNGVMNAGKIKISKSGEIILQFENYHHIIDGDTELCYANQVEQKIKELEDKNERLTTIAENARRVEDCYFRHFKEIKRALWLARAEMARYAMLYYVLETERRTKWYKVEQLCRAKAEEFK